MRDVLVRIRDTSRWNCAVGYAGDLAAKLRASLTGVLHDAADAPNGSEHAVVGERFETWARSMGATGAAWQVVRGDVGSALGRLSLWHDLVVVDRDAQEPAASVRELGAIMIASHAPVMLIPHRRREANLECIALAWNHSAEALKAIHAARPLIERAARVVLLEGGARDDRDDRGWSPAFDIDRLLERWGAHTDHYPIRGESSVAGERLVTAARRCRADLLVMGAYGRSRASEWAFGGATRSVLLDASIPVLLKH